LDVISGEVGTRSALAGVTLAVPAGATVARATRCSTAAGSTRLVSRQLIASAVEV